MKKFSIFVLIVVALIIIYSLFQGDKSPTVESPSTTEDQSSEDSELTLSGDIFDVSVEESAVLWEGRKTLIPNYKDNGSLALKSAQIFVDNGIVSGVIALFDMNSIKVLKTSILKDEAKLEGHLKSKDFFSVEEHPEAKLLITKVSPVEGKEGISLFSGALTIKGITNDVSGQAEVDVSEEKVLIKGKVDLDRTLWDVRFGSDKFFDNLANNVIDDFFTVEFEILASRRNL